MTTNKMIDLEVFACLYWGKVCSREKNNRLYSNNEAYSLTIGDVL